jgi:hypothetical protein
LIQKNPKKEKEKGRWKMEDGRWKKRSPSNARGNRKSVF